MNVVRGASGDARGVLAFGEALLSIAISGAVRSVALMVAGFAQIVSVQGGCTQVRLESSGLSANRKLSGNGLGAVSYTHLDVYKRQ